MKLITSFRAGVASIAATMMSIRPEVTEPIRAENSIGSICTSNPFFLPISWMKSTIQPAILLVWVSRKVKGAPVGVDPALTTCGVVWAKAGVASGSGGHDSGRPQKCPALHCCSPCLTGSGYVVAPAPGNGGVVAPDQSTRRVATITTDSAANSATVPASRE